MTVIRRHGSSTIGEMLHENEFTLALSSGFFGYPAHAGALVALEEHGLQPAKLSGSSSGALAGGLRASGMSSLEVAEFLLGIKRADFWDPTPGLGLLRGRILDRLLREVMPVTTFDDAAIPIAISVFNIRSRQTEVVETGDIVEAMRASSAFPFLFQPVNGKFDGGIGDHAGLAGVHTDELLLHHDLGIDKYRPRRKGTIRVRPVGLPRVTPFALENAREAFEHARVQMHYSLVQPYRGIPAVPDLVL